MKLSPVLLTISIAISMIRSQQAIAQQTDAPEPHPLEIHMNHWVAGSGQWRSPNPDHDPEAEAMTSGWIKEFGVNWKWGPNRHHMIGEIVGITADGQVFSSSVMYAFYNPVTEKVVEVHVGRHGSLALGEDRVRTLATPYGEPEVGDMLEYLPIGEVEILRHSNVFADADTQLSDVYQRDENGNWKVANQWRWTRVPQDSPN